MSGLVDRWSSELAKLRNKGKSAIFSDGSGRTGQEDAPLAAHEDERTGGWLRWPTGLARALQLKKLPVLQCSEASLSLLVDTFSA